MEEQITCLLSGQRPADPGKKFRYGLVGAAAIILSLIILPLNLYAESDTAEPFTPEKILSFTEYLVEKGEYFRAWTELRRLENYYPGYLSSEKFDVTALYLMYKGERYAEISEYSAGGGAGCPAGIIITDSYLLTGDYSSALALIDKYGAACPDEVLRENYARRKAYVSLITGEVYGDGKAALKPELSGYMDLVQYRERVHGTKKSPALAALLGFFPGAGYIYAGDEGTGFVAMTVVAVFGAVSYGSYVNGIDPLAILAGAVTLFFYGGNIAGGYLETIKYNETVDNMIEKKARSVLDLDRDIDKIYFRFGISSNGK